MNMNEFNYMSAALELFAATVTAVMLVGCFLERKHRTKTGRFLVWVLVAHTAMLLVDAPIWLLLAEPAPENVIWVKILSFFYECIPLCTHIPVYLLPDRIHIREKKDILPICPSYHFVVRSHGVALADQYIQRDVYLL